MYREEDIEKIEENYDKIRNEASFEYKSYYEPTLEEISNVYKVIKNYIIKKKYIVYGGFAQNLLIKIKNPKDVFYSEFEGAFYNFPDIADIEFYSSSPNADVIELTEELYTHKFKYIEGKVGMHDKTYKIFVNFDNYCDISYMPENVLANMPYIIIDGIKCAHPHFMLVDAYRVLTDPMTSYWRIDKSIKRFQKILKYYPITESSNQIDIKNNINDDILKFIRKKFIYKKKLIVVGLYACNYYIKKVDKSSIVNIPYYEVISTDFTRDVIFIYKVLLNKYQKKITFKEYYPFCEFFDKRVEYYYDNKIILKVYSNNNRCIVHNFSKKKFTYFGTYNLVIMYLFFEYYYLLINNNRYSETINNLIVKLLKLRNNYLHNKKITVIDDSPFRDFTFKCFGTPIDMKRSSLFEGLQMFKKGQRKFKYNPTGKPGKIPNYIFNNNSGTQIFDKKYLIIKKISN